MKLNVNVFEQAKKWAITEAEQNRPEALLKLAPIEQLIASEEIFVFDKSRCKQACGWDGKSPKCFCGRCRVYWVWHTDTNTWRAESC